MNYEHYGLNCGKKRHPLSNVLQNLLLCVRLDQEAFHQTKNLKKHDANVVIGPIFVQMANGLEINRVEEIFHLPGLSTETKTIPLNELETRHTVTGRVHATINGPQKRITIAEGNSAFADVQIKASEYKDGGPTVPDDLKKGELVCVQNAFFQINYKGALVLKVDPFARIVRLNEGDEEISLHTPRARWDVVGNCCL